MDVVTYEPHHLDAVLGLCKAEGWPVAANRERLGRAMTGPGVTALVALEGEPGGGRSDGERLLGFSQAVGDGAVTGYLCMLLVVKHARGQGIGKALVERTLRDAGILRLDLLSSEDAMPLYERFAHVPMAGFRLYPDESLRPSEPDA
jgi:ribosomal protein S18 acetylase RimI-like enzyme